MRVCPTVIGSLGLVLAAYGTALSGQANPPRGVGAIEGIVYDSLITRAPLRGATVYAIGTTLTATTDARGRFSIAGLPDATTCSHSRTRCSIRPGCRPRRSRRT